MPQERKLVTILFADVTGSTTLGEALDPEDVRVLMSRYYAHARQIVSEHGGSLEKFIGDAIMAVFGLSQAHSDDAERALAAALALHTAIADDNILASSFQLRIGINTGEVVTASEAARDDFLITGDAVNVAARLQQHAAPCETLVGERTMHASHTAFLFDEQRMVEVKGKSQPLRVFPLRGPRKNRQVPHPSLVGRCQDLLQLAVLKARVVEEHIPQVVSIVAPTGTGKSRLIEEFLQSLDPADGFQIATVHSLPYGQTLTYWPLRTLLTSFLGEEITRMHIIDRFRLGGYDTGRAIRLADSVLSGLGIPKEVQVDREALFNGWRLLLEIMARTAPRIIIFEDLHWASDSLLDLVEYILSLRLQAPLLFIILSRPELLERRPNWGGGRQNFTSLALQPISPTLTRILIKQLLHHASEEMCNALVERSGGNPFFVIELAYTICEQPERQEPVTSTLLPDTVHAVVQARLDQLSAIERAVIQVASIPMRRFQKAVLIALMEKISPQEIENALDGLLARDFIIRDDGETEAYTFRHMLISTVAYGTLARTERIRLHSKLVTWLEHIAGENDEMVEALAYHSFEAVKLARQSTISAIQPIEPARVIRYLKRAGELAAHIGNFSEARTYLQSAIDIAPHSDLLHLYEAQGDSGVFWNETTTDSYHKALSQWRSDVDSHPSTGARLMRKLLVCYTRGGLIWNNPQFQEEISSLSKEAHRLAEAGEDEYEQWRLHVADLFATRFLQLEDADRMRKVGLEAADYFQSQGDWVAFSESLDSYAIISGAMGAITDMLSASQRRLMIPNLPATERKDALFMISKACTALNDFDRCIQVVEEGLTTEQPHSLGESLSYAMYAAYLCGRWPKVKEFASSLAEMWEHIQHYDVYEAFDGYLSLFHLAHAYEDEEAKDATRAILRQISSDETSSERLFLEALFEDNPQKLETFQGLSNICLWELLLLYNEHGLSAPPVSLSERDSHVLHGSAPHWVLEINRALRDGDSVRLERAINEVEASHRIVHAARMRIILAQRTGDRSHLKHAREVFRLLGDRRSLRKLKEIEVALVA